MKSYGTAAKASNPKASDDDIIAAARKRMSEAIEADRDNREEALDDLENLAGRQWPEDALQEREQTGRPTITVNRLTQFVRQVTGDIRKLNPAIKVIAADDAATDEVADVMRGMIRQIEYASDASSVYEASAESAAQCGMGYFRILAEYAHETAFEQEVRIKRISNPFSVYFDPAARLSTRADAEFVFITEEMKTDDFKEAYPDAAIVDVEHDGNTDGLSDWMTDGGVIVAEYIWREPQETEIYLLPNGQVVTEKPPAPVVVLQTRKTTLYQTKWAKITGKEVLEGPTDLPCKYLPVVAVMGEEIPVGESIVRSSVIRWAKDSQRLYNYAVSSEAEFMAIQPKAPYLVTVRQIEGLENVWAGANDSNSPYLPYQPDEASPPPQRQMPPQPSPAILQMRMAAADDMKATTGIYDAGLGARSNEQSGVAIRQRQLESDISTSIYTDNLSKAIEQAGRILVDMIPKVYDTQRQVRVLGDDDTESVATINGAQQMLTPDGMPVAVPVNPLAVGRYDVRVSVGPNYSTKRQEVAETMLQLAGTIPAVAQVGADLLVRALDIPDGERLAERLKRTIPAEVRGDEEGQQPPDPQAMMQMQAAQQAMQMAQARAELELRKLQAEVAEAEADAAKAQAEAQEVAMRLRVAQTQAAMAVQQGFLPA